MSSSTQHLKLASFADRFPAEMKERVEKAATDLERATAAKLEDLIVEPVATGALKRSRSLKATSKGLQLGYTDVAAIPIDVGRIRSKTFRRTTKSGKKSVLHSRMLGSTKTPEGMTGPAIRALRLSWDEVVSDASKDF